MTSAVLLEAVPNVSAGSSRDTIDRVAAAFSRGAELLDVHSDPDHDRSVYTLVAPPGSLADALLAGAAEAVAGIQMRRYAGLHPAIGALDVCPVVWLRPDDKPAAAEEALVVADRLAAELELPVFLYGELASSPERGERAFFRNGGLPELTRRLESGELAPDRGPARAHPRAGATLVTARPPLVAFNVELDTDDLGIARAVASSLRESGGGPLGVRAIGLLLASGRTQISINVHDPFAVPLAEVVALVTTLAAAHGASPVSAELVGLAPSAALEGFPDSPPIRGFNPQQHLLEPRLAAMSQQPDPGVSG